MGLGGVQVVGAERWSARLSVSVGLIGVVAGWGFAGRRLRAGVVVGHNAAMSSDTGDRGFEGATFLRTSFRGATLRSCDVSGVTMRSVDVGGLDIDSHDLFFGSLVVNGVDVVPFVDAELNRQFPGRELQKAQTPEGLRDGWVAVQSAWQETVAGTPVAL